MSRIKNKFVLVGNELIIGRVTYHRELDKSPIGGGWWYFHKEQNKLILFGSSSDFGYITKEQALNADILGSFSLVDNLEVIFDQRSSIEVLNILVDHLGEEEGIKAVTECDFI